MGGENKIHNRPPSQGGFCRWGRGRPLVLVYPSKQAHLFRPFMALNCSCRPLSAERISHRRLKWRVLRGPRYSRQATLLRRSESSLLILVETIEVPLHSADCSTIPHNAQQRMHLQTANHITCGQLAQFTFAFQKTSTCNKIQHPCGSLNHCANQYSDGNIRI